MIRLNMSEELMRVIYQRKMRIEDESNEKNNYV